MILKLAVYGNVLASSCPINCTCSDGLRVENNVTELAIECSKRITNSSLVEELDDYLAQRPNIRELAIQNAPLYLMPASICQLQYIIDLNLNQNKLTSLLPNCFSGMQSLHSFSAEGNQLENIPNGTFAGLDQLRRIVLNNNRIKFYGIHELINPSELTNLEEINLENNRLTALQPWPFVRLQALGGKTEFTAKLAYNKISKIQHKMPYLDLNNCSMAGSKLHLKIAKNKIGNINNLITGWKFRSVRDFVCLFFPIQNVWFDLDLSGVFHCSCVDFEIIKFIQKYDIGNEIPLVRQVRCSPNLHKFFNKRLASIPLLDIVCKIDQNHGCPKGCKCIQRPANLTFHVECEKGVLQTIPEKLPPPGESRFKLDFGENNRLKLVSRDYFVNTYHFNVSYCGISSINDTTWRGLVGIDKVILLHGNLLTTLPKSVTQVNGTFRRITLYNNTWSCTCENSWLKNYLTSIKSKLIHEEEILCYSPSRLKGKAILHLSEEEFCVDPIVKMLVITLSSVAAGILLIICLVFLMYRFRVKMHSAWQIHPFDRDECNDEYMDFDAFISFAEFDREISRDILEFLESKKYKVCYHERDFEPGRTIDSNICNAILMSKRTLCLVSQHFLQSSYCMREFDVALDRNINLKKKRLIMILLEPVDQLQEWGSDMETVSLIQYLQSHTYVGHGSKDYQQALLYAMPMKRLGGRVADTSRRWNNENMIMAGDVNVLETSGRIVDDSVEIEDSVQPLVDI